MKTIKVLSEDETLSLAIAGANLSRFGDGEFRLAAGGAAISQKADPQLAADLREILRKGAIVPNKGEPLGYAIERAVVVCLPNFENTPNKEVWDKYRTKAYRDLLGSEIYGSAFITRPDNAPWIDRPEFWDKVETLWKGKPVILVRGDEKSLTPSMLASAHSVDVIEAPARDAYADINSIHDRIVRAVKKSLETRPEAPLPMVIMCLGATATVLAWRLRGIHAIDLGHIGLFMRHRGAYAIQPDKLVSKEYREQLHRKHQSTKWGIDGHRNAQAVADYANELHATSILDYGCGSGTLKKNLPGFKVFEYDPGIRSKSQLPKPAHLVVCTDVLEHVEPEKLADVLKHVYLLASKGAYFVIALRPARETLPDGRNAHLIVQGKTWWIDQLRASGWHTMRTEDTRGLTVWATK